MPISVYVAKAQFSDGTALEFSPDDIVVLVGPNNVGKSMALRDVYAMSQNPSYPAIVVTSVDFGRIGSIDDFEAWLNQHCYVEIRSAQVPIYHKLDYAVAKDGALHVWSQVTFPHDLSRMFFLLATADARLHAADAAQSIPITRQTPTHPIHILYRDDRSEKRLCRYFRTAFGEDLTVHRAAGSEIPLHCGQMPTLKDSEDRVSPSYVERLEALPRLESQGDGMRSFVGCLLHSIAGDHLVMLIDEPEAFLHPPQARLLGSLLAKERSPGTQIFIATHSSDVLHGLLDEKSAKVRVVRLRRQGDVNIAKELDPGRVRELWNDPLLYHSDVLDGLFHESVILCEADGDCRFYAAVMDSILNHLPNVRRPDVMFINCAGTSRMPMIVSALRGLEVPVRVVVDFDTLRDPDPLRGIFEGLGGGWVDIESDWRRVKQSIEERRPEIDTAQVKLQVQTVLDGVTVRSFPRDAALKIQDIVANVSPWSRAKKIGKAELPSGDPTQACDLLLSKVAARGLFIVEEGELESFDRRSGGHGPAWVNEVLGKDLYGDAELESARLFVTKFLALAASS